MANPLDNIASLMIERYSRRYKELGHDVKTLGWGNTEQQGFRFKQAVEALDFKSEKSVLDIGCGFGDLLALLTAEKKGVSKYIGWDLNPDLIAECKEIWENIPIQTAFELVNIGKQIIDASVADIGFLLGVLNLNLKEEFDNYQYSEMIIRNSFSAVNELLVVDFLSTKLTPDYPKEDFVFYHDPARMLEFALTLTPNVVLKHNYAPIPQKEFMLFLYK